MKYLTVDFGSTYTKLTAIDTEKGDVVGTAAAFTTIETDVMEGFNNGMQQLEAQIGHLRQTSLLQQCCGRFEDGCTRISTRAYCQGSKDGSFECRRKGGKNLFV